MDETPREKAGVFAVRQAPILTANLRAALSGRPTRTYRPQREYLKLIGLGGGRALASKWGLSGSGAAFWRWKDRIDRRFMTRLNELPIMKRPTPPAIAAEGVQDLLSEAPLCGGCGAKVPAGALADALSVLRKPGRSDVELGPGDDAAILSIGGERQVVSVDQLRAVVEDPFLMGEIATVHALGDIWAMGAAPQAAFAAVTLPPMIPAKQTETLREVLGGVERVLADAGADLAGGHSSLGAELSIGLTVTGLAPKSGPIGVSGAAPGDRLVLTKPIGVGVILAGEMRGLASGPDVATAFEHMRTRSSRAAHILSATAHAMTDVTGFGLAGHLAAMMRASGTCAALDWKRIPTLPGAASMAAAGVRSSLFAGNVEWAGPIHAPKEARASPVFELLFDPQTAGGLLAALPAARATEIVDELRCAGVQAAIIGEVFGKGEGVSSIELLEGDTG